MDKFIANSRFIARRIEKVYRRSAEVIYPPVDVSRFQMREAKEDFYLTASRLVPYKKVLLIVQAFARMPEKRLVVIGDGPDFEAIKAVAPPNIRIMGYQPDEVMVDHMQRAKAFVFAAEEDFGITPVEAQACGTPVIAFGKGGSLETVRGAGRLSDRTGTFFAQQSVDHIVDAVRRFESGLGFSAAACRAHAERFSRNVFRENLRSSVAAAWSALESARTAYSFSDASVDAAGSRSTAEAGSELNL